MKKINIHTRYLKMSADTVTPVGIYLRLRDQFPFTQLLESCDAQAGTNSFSYICVLPFAGVKATYKNNDVLVNSCFLDKKENELHIPENQLQSFLSDFQQSFAVSEEPPVKGVAGMFGYTSYDAVRALEETEIPVDETHPFLRYDVYQYVIAIDHFHDVLYLCENLPDGAESVLNQLAAIISNKSTPQYTFALSGEEKSNLTDTGYMDLVEKAKAHCKRGDVFQLVLSRRFEQAFTGDELNVYRALRTINPSPYLFYFDYGNFRLFGSSPETQLVIKNNEATVFPIAGTFRRTGDDVLDRAAAFRLQNDPKENAAHVMLADLARNDLSRIAGNVQVKSFRELHFYSHVIHLVSEVTGTLKPGINSFDALGAVFPAGTLSGAPKCKAVELIGRYEKQARGFYGGTIGFAGFNGDFNHAIMIRTFFSCNGKLIYQAGAGIVALSDAAGECAEVHHKLGALRKAMQHATQINQPENTPFVLTLA